MSKPYWYTKGRIPNDYYTEVVDGNIPGYSIIHKFGHGHVTTAITPITHSTFYRTPIAATALEFVSDDANDTELGTGAREIKFIGIDSTYAEVEFTIATNGLTPVPLPTNLLRLYRWFVNTSGSYATQLTPSHVGTLTVRAVSDASVWSIIPITPFSLGQSEIAAYTIPVGFRGYIIQQELHVESTKSVDIVLFRRSGIDVVTAPFEPMKMLSHYVGVTGISELQYRAPLGGLTEKTDFGYMGVVASQSAAVSIHFSILLIADGY